MSKSEGNFLTLVEAVEKFSADGTRLCLADVSDSIEDVNFIENIAIKRIRKLFNFIEWIEYNVFNMKADFRHNSKYNYDDKVFERYICF